MADQLEPSEIFTLLRQGGFSRDQAITMTAIAQAESAGNLGAVGDVRLENRTWGPSVGLFQVRTLKAETGQGTDRDIEHLTGDPQAQVKAALHISNGGTNFRAWSTFTHGSYRKFLDEDLHEVPLSDLPGGGTGAGSGAGDALDPFAIDRGKPPVKITEADQDGDGLTDRFEELLGTDAKSSDSDQDGLSDAFETSTSHTDPLSKDTDKDGITDDVEQARGSDAGHAEISAAAQKAGFGGLDTMDSDKDGLSDGFETRHGTNPQVADSDHDGLLDGDEFARGSDPTSVDSNHDGLSDGFAVQNDLPEAPDLNDLPDDDPAHLDPAHLDVPH